MAEIEVTPKQRERLARLLTEAAKDPVLRAQLAADPRAVLTEYRLERLLGERQVQVGLDVTGGHDEELAEGVLGFIGFHIDANTPHADAHLHQDISTPHADAAPHVDIPEGHADWSHQDIPRLHFDV
jgi:hypothetical protein